jgi:hypothetical protein
VRVWTAHEKLHASPILVREGFSVGALILGPIWLAAHDAWIPAAGALLLTVLFLVLPHPPSSAVLVLGLAILLGFSGRDLVRWSIARRGYLESTIVTGRDEYDARARLLSVRPDLVEQSMAAETAP